jgi:hypothetical protein
MRLWIINVHDLSPGLQLPQRMSSQTEGDPVTSYSILINQPINIMSYKIVLGIFLLSSENNDK